MTPTLAQCYRWRLTTYHVGDVKAHTGPLVTMRTPAGSALANVPASAFAEAALEGATKLANGKLAGVASPPYSACDADEFRPVFDIAKRNGWIPNKAGYAGIQVAGDHVVAARNFELRKTGPAGWPIEHGVECLPFRTVAADIGALAKHDPGFRGKGGVCPLGTRAWIAELVGKRMPDGSEHDGWVTINDTGGGIYGAHFDLFAGSKTWGRAAGIPSVAHVWFAGVEKLPQGYSYGLAP